MSGLAQILMSPAQLTKDYFFVGSVSGQHQRRAADGDAVDLPVPGVPQQHFAGEGAQGRGPGGLRVRGHDLFARSGGERGNRGGLLPHHRVLLLGDHSPSSTPGRAAEYRSYPLCTLGEWAAIAGPVHPGGLLAQREELQGVRRAAEGHRT